MQPLIQFITLIIERHQQIYCNIYNIDLVIILTTTLLKETTNKKINIRN